MKLIEEIKNYKILPPDNEIKIDEVLLKKISKKLNISFVLKKALPYKCYNSLKEKCMELLKDLKLEIEISIGYIDEELSNEELKEYLNEIIKALTNASARFKALSTDDCIIDGNSVTFLIAYDALGVENLCLPVKNEFAKYGLNVNVYVKNDPNKSVEAQIQALDDKIQDQLNKQNEEAKAAINFNKKIQEQKKSYGKEVVKNVSHIKVIPTTYEEIQAYQHTNGPAVFLIEAYVFGIETKTFPNRKSMLVTMKVTDETDSILVKRWVINEEEKNLYLNQVKNGTILRITGSAEYDNFAKDVVLTAQNVEMVGMKKEDDVLDDAQVKRVELHCHTKMSTLDGLSDASDYMKLVSKWGWKTMAFTDHNGMHAVPDIAHALPKYPDFKPIYGTELAYIDDSKYFITFNERDIPLKDASYVVFDIETTGLSQTYDDIIEIAAVKVFRGGIISTYEPFVNPKKHIPEKITSLTSIDDDMVRDSRAIEEILPEFLDYCKGCILVAHNAKFDVGMIYKDMKKLGISAYDYPVIDTLNLFRAGYYDQVKTFNLKSLSKFFKVKQEHHHRAIDDTRVTALCFICMLNDLYSKEIYNYKDINSLIDPNIHYRYLIPPHITMLAKNPVGYKNLFKIVSDALTNHFYSGNARALKSVIEKYRDGVLLGSGCVNGSVFELALNRSQEELEEEMM